MVDSVPRYMESLDYIKDNNDKVQFIKTILFDEEHEIRHSFYETYWDNQQNFIIEVLHEKGR